MIQVWLLPVALPLFTQMQAPATPQGQRFPAWSFSRALSPILLTPHLGLSSFLPTSIPSLLHFLAVQTRPLFFCHL